ncbi:phytoene desaturase family protein [Williamsia herbipolensis]|uniref:phytoene desaturase family protein n=1 Tax=Williamsia herbipolensis TaxID=1603258 RepID=UPI0005F79F91|nr:NAD(P)/FAD-dependent oxidoreductase [Williamsia herbipolensis]
MGDLRVNAQWDAVVVGSGLGGLSAAAYLAAAGQKVLLLERYTTLGGSSHVFRRKGKWEFDCGVHYLGHCGPDGIVTTMMRGLGLDDRIEWLPMDPDGFDRIVAPDFELATPVGWDRYLENLIDAFPEERRAIRRFHAIMQRIGESGSRADLGSAAGLARWSLRAGWAAPFMVMPYAATLAACRLSPRAVLALSVQCGALASTPAILPTAAMATFFQDYVGTGSYYPKGGGQMLAAGFAEVITAHGGSIRTNADVISITIEGGCVNGVLLADGEVLSAPVVVSDADVIKTYTDFVGLQHLPRLFRERVSRWKMSQPLINGFFGVDHDVSDKPNSNYFAIPSWDDATSLRSLAQFGAGVGSGRGFSDGAEWARAMSTRQPMFVQSSSRRDPGNSRAVPPGHSTIEVQTITPSKARLWGIDGRGIADGDYSDDPRYAEIKKIVIDGMYERMEQVFPGASSKVVVAELATPATQTRFVNNTRGAPFGLQTRVTQIGPLRPKDVTPIPGLFTVGTSTAWGPGTVGAMYSGVHAAGSIVGRDLIAEIESGAVIADTASIPAWAEDFDPLSTTRGLTVRRQSSDA